MPRLFQIPFFKKKTNYKGPPIITENKRGRIWKDRLGHIIKRKGKFKGTDMSHIHFFCHVCGRIEGKDGIDSGLKN